MAPAVGPSTDRAAASHQLGEQQPIRRQFALVVAVIVAVAVAVVVVVVTEHEGQSSGERRASSELVGSSEGMKRVS